MSKTRIWRVNYDNYTKVKVVANNVSDAIKKIINRH